MMSVSGGWFFVVASEAITVNGQSVTLPGIGSYIAMAIADKNLGAIGWAILAMLVGIIIYDQLFFRPLVAWADKFKFETSPGEESPHIAPARHHAAIAVSPAWSVRFPAICGNCPAGLPASVMTDWVRSDNQDTRSLVRPGLECLPAGAGGLCGLPRRRLHQGGSRSCRGGPCLPARSGDGRPRPRPNRPLPR